MLARGVRDGGRSAVGRARGQRGNRRYRRGCSGGPPATAGADAGAGADCFDVSTCLMAAAPATVDAAHYTVTLPPGAHSASVNVALQFPIGGPGVCGVDACWVVLTDWTLKGTQIQLPQPHAQWRPRKGRAWYQHDLRDADRLGACLRAVVLRDDADHGARDGGCRLGRLARRP